MNNSYSSLTNWVSGVAHCNVANNEFVMKRGKYDKAVYKITFNGKTEESVGKVATLNFIGKLLKESPIDQDNDLQIRRIK